MHKTPRRKSVLFPDTIHFHKKNYRYVFYAFKLMGYRLCFDASHTALKKAHGDYNLFEEQLEPYIKIVSNYDVASLLTYSYKGIPLFPLIKAELLSYLLSLDNWQDTPLPNDDTVIIRKAYHENKKTLCLNIAASLFWIDRWEAFLKSQKRIKCCVIFSGSVIYTKTLNRLLQNTAVTVFKTEHFLTGNAYYFEEKYTPIANKSDIAYPAYYLKRLKDINKLPLNLKAFKINKTQALLQKMHNKNVIQPKSGTEKLEITKPVLLIFGQVINDFSLLETLDKELNSLMHYKSLIKAVLSKTDYTVIVKSHPWERHKIHLKAPVTFKKLEAFKETLPKVQKARLILLESFNLYDLIALSTHCVALNSQSLIEVAMRGKKPIQLGNAFFGGKGFSYDFMDGHAFVEALSNNTLATHLSEREKSAFLDFIVVLYEYQLVEDNLGGVFSLCKKVRAARAPNHDRFIQFV